MRNRFKRMAALLACCLLLGATGCAGAGDDNVFVIGKTGIYHRDECPRLRMALAQTMTRGEALALDCKPCPGCRPDARR